MCSHNVLEGQIEVVARHLHYSNVRDFFVFNLNRDLEFFKTRLLLMVFHISKHNAFLHLTDVLLLHHSNQMLKFLNIVVWIIAVSFTNTAIYNGLFPFFL